METHLDCIPCFIRQTLEAVKLATDDEHIQEKVLRKVLGITAKLKLSISPPVMGRDIHMLVRKLSGTADPYAKLKRRTTQLALSLLPELRRRIVASPDPFEAAVRIAVAGNIIDFGAQTAISEDIVMHAINEALTVSIDREQVDRLRKAVYRVKDILFIGDNAGEIVLDRLLLERMPGQGITFVVRGGPIINDATMEDAEASGLTGIVDVIDSGYDSPGTIIEKCSPEFKARFFAADVVIAKGQGNYETLSDVQRPIFFLLKAKCPVIARDLNCNVGSLQVFRGGTRIKTESGTFL